MIDKWTSRKVLFGLLTLIIGVGIEMYGPRGLTETVAAFLAAVGATYFIGNIGEHYTAAKAAPSSDNNIYNQIPSDPQAVVELSNKIDALIAGASDEKAKYLTYLDALLKGQQYIIKAAGLAEEKK